MQLICRKKYLDKLLAVRGTPDIKVITGVRRSGKSKLLESFIDYIAQNEHEVNIIHIDFNRVENEVLRNKKALYDYVQNAYVSGKKNYLFIDEVQLCDGFEWAINGLHTLEKYDIYMTRSNAFLMSSDLATLFTGRTFSVAVYPFSFAEYLEYYGKGELEKDFSNYARQGGMAGSYLFSEQEQKDQYLNEVFNTLIVRDIYQKHHLRQKDVFANLCNFLMDNVSNLTSPHSIAKFLLAKNKKISDKTISSYLEYLCQAFMFYRFGRYDIHGKNYLSTSDKYYLCDHSFRYAVLGTKNSDFGRVYENIVAMELLRRGYQVYVGVLFNSEIDFVAIKRDEKIYIQVAANIDEESRFQREIAPLLKIRDVYPKILLARYVDNEINYEGVKVQNLAQWLLN